jgi:hypothetical protein
MASDLWDRYTVLMSEVADEHADLIEAELATIDEHREAAEAREERLARFLDLLEANQRRR